jgi:hypothetical protein
MKTVLISRETKAIGGSDVWIDRMTNQVVLYTLHPEDKCKNLEYRFDLAEFIHEIKELIEKYEEMKGSGGER